MIKRLLNASNALFLLLVLLIIIPIKPAEAVTDNKYLLILIGVMELYLLIKTYCDKRNFQQTHDITGIVYSVIILWELLTDKLGVIDPFLFPAPDQVIMSFCKDFGEILKGLGSSMFLLGSAYSLALLIAIPSGLLIGWHHRLFKIAHPISKVLSAVPPIVYIPYAIAILPNFKMASILVIFLGAFWPILVSTINATVQIDKKIIDSARMLRIKERKMLFSIILPSITPQVLNGCGIGLIFSFILLTSAEMIGATSGIGWYVKYYSDFGDYGKVIVGIIFIGFVVTGVMYIFDRIQKYLLRWQEKRVDS